MSALLTAAQNLSAAHRHYLHTSQARRSATFGGRLNQEVIDADNIARESFEERLQDLFLQANLADVEEQLEDAEQHERNRQHAETVHLEGA